MTDTENCTWGACPSGFKADPSREPVAFGSGSTVQIGSRFTVAEADGVGTQSLPTSPGNGQNR